jgi:hypothetical protein
MRKQKGYRVLIVWADGVAEFLKSGIDGTEPAWFATKEQAKYQADFMRIGMEEETQAIWVVFTTIHEYQMEIDE